MKKEQIEKLPNGFGTKEDAIELLRETISAIKSQRSDEAIRIKVSLSFRQWDNKKNKFV